MGRTAFAVAVSLFLAPALLHADPVADENARLRLEVQDLKARNDALQRMCVSAAAQPAPPASAAAPATAALVPPAAPAMAAPPPTAVVVTAASVTPPPAAPSPNASAAVAPMPVAAAASASPPSNPYGNTGCDRGFLKGPEHGPWEKQANWSKLSRGASMQEVEAALGVEHYDVREHNGDTKWEYGSCGSTWEGMIMFDDHEKVVSITPPDR